MRFRIMQETPSCRAGETDAETTVGGREGLILRILILRDGRPLSKEQIADYLTRYGQHEVRPSSVAGYIGRLREKVGPDRVRSEAGYSWSGVQADVDAFAFRARADDHGVCDVADVDSMDSDDADLYDQLLDLHAMWQANPAHPFADGEDEDLLDIYLEFERYRDCLSRCIIYADLRSRRRPRILKAATRLESLVRLDSADEQSWALLFRARASLPGRDAALGFLLGRIREQFPGVIPNELRYVIDRISAGHADALFEFDQRPRSPGDQQRIEELARTIGISSASELELRRSRLEPLEYIRQTVSQLSVAGILGTKWVADSYVLNELSRLLERLDHSGGQVRFLLLDPGSEGYRRFSRVRWNPSSIQTMDILRRLSAAHTCFAVRLYDALPTFGIVLVDQAIVGFSPYLMEEGTERARTGWEAPQIILDRTAPWPLAHAFETLFDETWRTASPLTRSAVDPREA
jgi:Transcriptional regulatory protein, C terminal